MDPVRVYVDGIFDLFHPGHGRLFEKAVAKGQELFPGREVVLLVGVCDDDVKEYKRQTIMTYEERQHAVSCHKLVNEVLWAGLTLTAEYMEEHAIDLVIHGDDFDDEKQKKYYGPAVEAGKFTTVPYEQGVSTTELLTRAKVMGRFDADLSSTQIDQAELVERVRWRTWSMLSIDRSLNAG